MPSHARILCVLIASTVGPQLGAAEPINFVRDVRSILSNRCFACHGPDAEQRQSGLRLDEREGALGTGDSGKHAVVPRDPAASELLRRVASTDENERMPPPKFGKPLTDKEVETLRRWIESGAEYQGHWAYQPVTRHAPPTLEDAPAAIQPWPTSPIDHWIAAAWTTRNLQPTPPADRNALLRRAALDITGLPPSDAEIDRFLKDDRPDAYGRMIDRLLADPAYGEHAARGWLDLARYADSAGYADDPPRTIWGYRDWVIRAFNDNKPFDQFTIEQIAGDMLPQPTEDQLIATAFHRNTLTNNEGGTNDEEFRNVAIVDRVNTTMAVWTGTTINCAQCHSHKYDPISQHDFFRLFAIFNQTEDADRRDESPFLEWFTEDQKARRAALTAEQQSLQTILATSTAELVAEQTAWEPSLAKEGEWNTVSPTSMTTKDGTKLQAGENGLIIASEPTKQDTYELILPTESTADVVGIRIQTAPDESLPGKGAGFGGGNFVITQIKLFRVTPGVAEPTPVALASAGADFSQSGFPASGVLDEKNAHKTGWAVAGAADKSHTLAIRFKEPVRPAEGETWKLVIDQRSQYDQHVLGRFSIQTTRDPQATQAIEIPPEIIAIIRRPVDQRNDQEREQVASHFRKNISELLKPQRTRLLAVEGELKALQPITTVPIQRQLPTDRARVTKIQRRGNFLDLGDEVSAGVPASLHPGVPATEIQDRLRLAQWLVDGQHPLTGRVYANRLWETFFGQGLVRTSEEFGSQGDLPTHPELLDWLADEFVRMHWDQKRMIRRLVTTATYRQSSKVEPEALERDPDNRWLARGPRFRMSAEMVRDQALAVSGLLNRRIGGPPVRPPQPSMGVNAAFGGAVDWQPSAGGDRYRRGLYTTWRRSNPYPSMTTFDAPNREVCALKRDRTNTPLQALVTLNDPVYLEVSRAFAQQVLQEPNPAERTTRAFEKCLSRAPTASERDVLDRLLQDTLQRLRASPQEANEFLASIAEPKQLPVAAQDPIELAAWTMAANVLLNLDETLMKR